MISTGTPFWLIRSLSSKYSYYSSHKCFCFGMKINSKPITKLQSSRPYASLTISQIVMEKKSRPLPLPVPSYIPSPLRGRRCRRYDFWAEMSFCLIYFLPPSFNRVNIGSLTWELSGCGHYLIILLSIVFYCLAQAIHTNK